MQGLLIMQGILKMQVSMSACACVNFFCVRRPTSQAGRCIRPEGLGMHHAVRPRTGVYSISPEGVRLLLLVYIALRTNRGPNPFRGHMLTPFLRRDMASGLLNFAVVPRFTSGH